MNWGYKIIVVYIIFASGILLLVYKASTQNEGLVTTNYYEKELKYQQKIDTDKRTGELAGQVRFEQQPGRLNIYLPKDFHGKKLSGEIVLYCPSDENKDLHERFTLHNASEPILFQVRHKGMNILQVSWEAEGQDYYFEQKLIII